MAEIGVISSKQIDILVPYLTLWP